MSSFFLSVMMVGRSEDDLCCYHVAEIKAEMDVRTVQYGL